MSILNTVSMTLRLVIMINTKLTTSNWFAYCWKLISRHSTHENELFPMWELAHCMMMHDPARLLKIIICFLGLFPLDTQNISKLLFIATNVLSLPLLSVRSFIKTIFSIEKCFSAYLLPSLSFTTLAVFPLLVHFLPDLFSISLFIRLNLMSLI